MSFDNIFTQVDGEIRMFFFEKFMCMVRRVSLARCIVPKIVFDEREYGQNWKPVQVRFTGLSTVYSTVF